MVRIRTLGIACAVAAFTALSAAPALAAAPKVKTGAAGSVTYQSATLTGTVDPGGAATEVYFQYGTTATYGTQSAPTEIAAGTVNVPVSIPIAGLTAATRYHYRLVATNVAGTTLGADAILVTAKIPLALAITAAPNPIPFGGSVTVEGTLSGTGSAGAAVVLQQDPFPYTTGFVDVGNPELTLANGTFVFNVLGVGQNTQYRVVSGTVALPVVSAVVVVNVTVSVTLRAQRAGTHKHPEVHFWGTIAPPEPSARIAFERLVGSSWKVVGGTIAKATATNGVVAFNKVVRINQGGFFRALVLPVEGAHVSGYSETELVRLK